MSFFKRRWTFVIFGLVLALSAVSVTRALTSPSPTVPRPPDVRRAERALAGPNDEKMTVPEGRFLSAQGVVEPRDRETKVSPSIGGRIAAIAVKEGDRVEAGAVLVELESAVEKASLAAAEADLHAAEAELTRARAGDRVEDRAAALAESRAADARAQQAEGIAARVKKAFDGGAATGDELDRAQRDAEAQRATADLSRAKLSASHAGSRAEDVLAADARREAASARVDESRARLEQRSIRAPVAGEVLSLKVRVGEYTQPGDAVVVLGDTRVLRVRVDVDERDLGKVSIGASLIVHAVAFPGEDFAGKVVELGRRMGRKNIRSDDPVERNDTKILEVVGELETRDRLVVGQRVVAFIALE